MTGSTVCRDCPSLDAMGTLSVELVVKVNFNAAGTITYADYAVHSDQVGSVSGLPVSMPLRLVRFLPVTEKNPTYCLHGWVMLLAVVLVYRQDFIRVAVAYIHRSVSLQGFLQAPQPGD